MQVALAEDVQSPEVLLAAAARIVARNAQNLLEVGLDEEQVLSQCQRLGRAVL